MTTGLAAVLVLLSCVAFAVVFLVGSLFVHPALAFTLACLCPAWALRYAQRRADRRPGRV